MKSEHEMLKEITDVIGYKKYTNMGIEFGKKEGFFRILGYEDIEVDVREIIFTQDFMDRVGVYLCENLNDNEKSIEALSKCEVIIYHLNNPVDYLYNTLELGKQ